MRYPSSLLLVAIASACLLDPHQVIDRPALRVRFDALPAGGAELVLAAQPEQGETRTKRARTAGLSSVEILFESGSLAGTVDLAAVLVDGAGADIGCGVARVQADGQPEPVVMAMGTPTDDLNCGRCGAPCATAHAASACDSASRVCGPLSCAPGWKDANGERNDGCEAPIPGCEHPAAEESEAACTDGDDNDCDLKTDCEDTGCSRVTRQCMMSLGCAGIQAWDCPSRAWGACEADPALEADPATCSDGMDDDCDGKTDCQDPGCQTIKQACGLTLCAGVKTWICLAGLWSPCEAYLAIPENGDMLCSNGLDDDCNGKTDCQDPGCAGRPCARGKICCGDGSCGAQCP